MDTEIHGELIKEISQYFEISDENKEILFESTQMPDKESIDKIVNYEIPDSDNFWRNVGNALEWIGNAIYQSSDWHKTHCTGAIESFNKYFQFAYEILVDKDIKNGNEYHEGLKNLAYACHFIVDIGTPYHSKRFRDVLEIDDFTNKKNELTEEEFNNYYGNRFMEFVLFFMFHKEFEDDVKKFWEIEELYNAYLIEIEKAVNTIDKPPNFTNIKDVNEWLNKYINNLKENAVELINGLQEAYLQEHSESDEKEEKKEKINLEVFEYSKKCIYNIAIVVALVFSIFFPRKN